MKKRRFMMIILLLVFLVGCSSKEATTNKNEWIVGFDNTFAPMGFTNEEGKNVGFDLDLAKKMEEKLGVIFVFQPIEWSLKETELLAKNIDMIWNGYSITEARKEKVLFSTPYMSNRQLIIVNKDSNIQSKKDLSGKTLSTQDQSSALEAINKDDIVKEIDALITYTSYNEVFSDLDNQRVDAIVVDETLGLYYLKTSGKNEQYRMLDDHFGEEEYAVGFRKEDQQFVEEFNQSLEELIENQTVEEIYNKWFQ